MKLQELMRLGDQMIEVARLEDGRLGLEVRKLDLRSIVQMFDLKVKTYESVVGIERRKMTAGVRSLYLISELFSDATIAVSGTVRDRLARWGITGVWLIGFWMHWCQKADRKGGLRFESSPPLRSGF